MSIRIAGQVIASAGSLTAHNEDPNAHADIRELISQGGGSSEAKWGAITGDINAQTDLTTAIAEKQDKLTAGEGITIEGNVISATGGEGGGSVEIPDNVYTQDNLVAGENVVFEQAEEKINGEVQGSLNITSDFVASGFSDDNVIIANDPINETSNLQSFEICTSFKLYSTTNCGIIDTAGSAGNARWRITLQDGLVRARTMFYASSDADVDIFGTTYVQPGIKYKLKYAYLADTNNGMYGYRLWVLPEGEEFTPSNIQGFHPYVDRPYVSTTHNTLRIGDNSAGGNALDGEIYLGDTYINVNGERAWEAVTKGGKTKVSVTGAYTEDNLVAGENVTITDVLPEGGIDEHTLACWHFDEDLVDEKNNLALVGSVTEVSAEASKFGNGSFKMSSSGHYATVISDLFADLFKKDFTVDFWLRREEFYVGNTLFGFSNNESSYDVRSFPFSLALGSAGSSTSSDIFRINDTKIGSTGLSDVKVFHHVAITFVRETSTCSLYLNGNKLGEYIFSTLPTDTRNLSFYFPGSGTTMRLDEFRVSDCIRWTKDFTPPTEPYTLATGPSKKAINAVIPPVELPSDLYRQSNLLGGKDIEIIPEPVEGGIDEHTLACFHLDTDGVDVVTGQNIYPGFTADTSVRKFGTASGMWGNSISMPFSVNSYEDFSFDYWVFVPNAYRNSTRLGFQKNGFDIGTVLFNSDGGITFGLFGGYPTSTKVEFSIWTHIYVYYKAEDRSFHLFVNGKEVFSIQNEESKVFSDVKQFVNDGYTVSRFDEIRISKCIRWTEDFTPPTQPYRKAEPTGNYLINFTGEAGSAGGAGVSFPLFYHTFADHILNDASWLRGDTFSWQGGDMYVSAYNHLVADLEGNTAETETIGSTTITFYRAKDGHKIVLADQESKVSDIYRATGVAWYYILDTENKRFKLPRTKHAFAGLRTGVGNFVEAGLPNITGSVASTKPINNNNDPSVSGALYKTGGSTLAASATNGGSSNDYTTIYLDASRSSSIYGKSNTVQPPSTEQYLYFYVGNTVRNQTEVDVGTVTEQLNGKQDVLGNNVDYVVETFRDGANWYRVYKSGWVEQGGNIPFAATGSWAAGNITFLKPMADTNYYLNGRGNWSDRQSCDLGVNSKTTTGCNVTVAINTLTTENGAWYVCGQGAI